MNNSTAQQPAGYEHLHAPLPEATAFPIARISYREQSLRNYTTPIHSDYLPELYESERRYNECKRHVIAYPVVNTVKKTLVRVDNIPYSCKSPFCLKCYNEKVQSQFAYVYPYCKAHTRRTVKHIIFTTPTFPIAQLPENLELFDYRLTQLEEFLSTAKISKRLQKHAQSGIIFFEPHFQPDTHTFNLHVHVGFFCFTDIALLQRFWNNIWGNPTPSLNVRYPQWKGRIHYETSKYAFSQYISKRRVEVGIRTPTLTYYKHLHHRQLIRLFGLARRSHKVYFTQVQTIRKKVRAKLAFQKVLQPDERRFNGIGLPVGYDRAKFTDFLRWEIECIWAEENDSLTPKAIVSKAMRNARDYIIEYDITAKDTALMRKSQPTPLRHYFPNTPAETGHDEQPFKCGVAVPYPSNSDYYALG